MADNTFDFAGFDRYTALALPRGLHTGRFRLSEADRLAFYSWIVEAFGPRFLRNVQAGVKAPTEIFKYLVGNVPTLVALDTLPELSGGGDEFIA